MHGHFRGAFLPDYRFFILAGLEPGHSDVHNRGYRGRQPDSPELE